jgi:hypothetical protein
VGDPNVPSDEVATVEHAAPLLALGTAIVPVSALGTNLPFLSLRPLTEEKLSQQNLRVRRSADPGVPGPRDSRGKPLGFSG